MSLEEDKKEFEGQMTKELLKDLLEGSYIKIAGLQASLGAAEDQSITLRDQVATKMFPHAMEDSTSLEDAAIDAYRAADALLRVRETGGAYDSDVIDLLKRIRDTSETDQYFGRQVRKFLKDK